ncbi:hypothetical protein SpCBS45565_g02321 [Spizellomyces sp. 'palustris']|nr:hypothetical protein SpCBS45565_g02321 [Spizellomyces sp. 'palustris']
MDITADLRGRLREQSLRFWLGVADRVPEASLHLYDRNVVTGKLRGTDSTAERFNIRDLKTPVGIYPEAQVRSGDVRYLTMEL